MLLTGLFTGTVMFITSAVYIAGKLSGEQEMVLLQVHLGDGGKVLPSSACPW